MTRIIPLVRYQVERHHRSGHADHNNVCLSVPESGLPDNELLRLIARHLPGWQSTRFPSHMILYREQRDYTHGTVICRTPAA
jgi:hypothetical protein